MASAEAVLVETGDDTRNVTDEFKGVDHANIIRQLDKRGVELEIAIENLERDFNMGTIVRSANAFGIRRIHIIGRRQWNKRGAMATDKYLEVVYHSSVGDFAARVRPRKIIAIDNVEAAQSIMTVRKLQSAVLVFGAEGPGLSIQMFGVADEVVMIPQRGSTRSLNVGVAAGIAMWEWLKMT